MENSTPDRTSPSRPGRFHRGHARLRHHPIPAPSAEPPGELTYGEALTLLKLALLPTPAIWRDAAGIVDAMADPSTCVMQALGGYFTGLTTPARGTTCLSDHGPFDQGFGQPAASR